jgi:hypothetical protein
VLLCLVEGAATAASAIITGHASGLPNTIRSSANLALSSTQNCAAPKPDAACRMRFVSTNTPHAFEPLIQRGL